MSGQLPNGTHINPKFAKKVHINPKFVKNEEKCNSSVHVNPNFAKRALPPIPKAAETSPKKASNPKAHLNPNFISEYKMAIEGKIHVNPNFPVPKISPTSALEKENIKTPKTGPMKTPMNTFSSATKTLFKKIGNRKLVRVKASQETPKTFTKIGTRKLIRTESPKVKKVALQKTTQHSLEGTYKVKTSRKIVKTSSNSGTSPNKKIFIKKKRLSNSSPRKRFALAKVLNPFRIDRRPNQKILKRSITPRKSNSSSIRSSTKSVVKHKLSPKIPTPTKTETPAMMKRPAPPKPARKTPVKAKPSTTLINVQGVRYTISDNGRKLNRIAEVVPEQPKVPKKLFLEGEEYIEDEPGILIRSRNSMTRASITSAKQRSINTILKSQTRSKQYCMFFNKFGKCKKKEDGVCPYIHDPEKVAVCRKFLQGNCFKDNCLLAHKVAPEKMPVCKFFLEGVCVKDPCPYRHVKVNDSAEVCPDFLKGFCPLYDKCKKRHEHIKKATPKTPEKAAPPSKPKRKSISTSTPMPNIEKKKRYFEENQMGTPNAADNIPMQRLDDSFEKKRQRLLQKVELAKKGWTGLGAPVQELPELPSAPTKSDEQLNDDLDTTPYEEIDDGSFEEPRREPIGALPSFISLNTNEDENEEFEERLI